MSKAVDLQTQTHRSKKKGTQTRSQSPHSKTPYLHRLASKQCMAIETVSMNSLKDENSKHRDNTGKEIEEAKFVERKKISLLKFKNTRGVVKSTRKYS